MAVPEGIPDAPPIEGPIRLEALHPQEVIGSGGNAVVRRATLPNTGVAVALKEPYHRDDASTDIVDRFRTEAETWHRLDDHDHVVGVYDWATEPHPWIALEYMDGGTLRDRLGEISTANAFWIGARLADATHHAHRHGVAHLDLKPTNVLFRDVDDAWDVPKITDWGLARLLIERSTSLEGLSPEYAAPEQFDPDVYGQPDERTDIYQLGVVLYELLVGERPFTGRGKRLVNAVLNEAPLPPTSVSSGLSPGVDTVLGQALAKHKGDRYETVVDLRRDLEMLRTAGKDGAARLVADPTTAGTSDVSVPSDGRPANVPPTGYAAAIDLKDEGFVALAPGYFEQQAPDPERGWRTGFRLADVQAGIPAERQGHDDAIASRELLERLRADGSHLVVGRAGAGKSTLCKQVAVRWYDDPETGPVYYRESGAGRPFESTASLEAALANADGRVLVVVEDALHSDGVAILDLVEDVDEEELCFLLDTREEDLERFESRESTASRIARRRANTVRTLSRYRLPPLSEADVQRVLNAFEVATDRTVGRSAATLHEELETGSEFGVMVLLAYRLPVGGEEPAKSGLEAHVARRYRRLLTPERDDADSAPVRELRRFDPDLVADVGVMVNLLNASGLGVHPELVHALGHVHGHDVETHDAIAAIRAAFDGWMLYPTGDDGDADGTDLRSTHELWSTLFLRRLARDHETRQEDDRRRTRSEPRVGRCLSALFAVTETAHRQALEEEFPGSHLLATVESAPAEMAAEYVETVFDLGERWPALAPLFGTAETARYDLPGELSPAERHRAMLTRGKAHRKHGAFDAARTEYETVLDRARNDDDREGEAACLLHLGILAQRQRAFEEATEYVESSLEIAREIGDQHAEAMCLDDLGNIAFRRGSHEKAREYHQQSLEIARATGARREEASTLHGLSNVALSQRNHEEAREYLEAALAIQRDVGDRQGEAATLGNLGAVAIKQESYEKAHEYLQRSLEIKQDIGARDGVADSFHNLGVVAARQDAYDEAREYLQRSLEIRREIGAHYGEGASLHTLGKVAYERGAHGHAREYLQKSLDIFEEVGDHPRTAASLHDLGNVASDEGELERARERYVESLDTARAVDDRHREAENLRALGRVAEQRGDIDDAIQRYENAREVFEAIGAVPQEMNTLVDLVETARDAGRTELAHEQCETASQRLEAANESLRPLREELAELCNSLDIEE